MRPTPSLASHKAVAEATTSDEGKPRAETPDGAALLALTEVTMEQLGIAKAYSALSTAKAAQYASLLRPTECLCRLPPASRRVPAAIGRRPRSASDDAQDQMVTLPRRIFQRGGHVPGFKQWKIGKNLLTAGAGGEQIENVPDADTKAPQARPSAALRRIDGNSMGFAHEGLRASLPGCKAQSATAKTAECATLIRPTHSRRREIGFLFATIRSILFPENENSEQ